MWRVWIEIDACIVSGAVNMSPSVWRVWIEIWICALFMRTSFRSPSVWRVWIEMSSAAFSQLPYPTSPSVWRVWIEIPLYNKSGLFLLVTLRVEGVD